MKTGPVPSPNTVDRPYWDGAAAGVLRLQQCEACGQWVFPAARWCPHCGGSALRWRGHTGRGRIWSWVEFHRTYFTAMPAPYVVVRVELDDGPRMMANLVDTPPALAAIGARVRVVFRSSAEGATLPQFVLDGSDP